MSNVLAGFYHIETFLSSKNSKNYIAQELCATYIFAPFESTRYNFENIRFNLPILKK